MTFVPEDDQAEFIIKLEYPTDYSLESTLRRTLQVERNGSDSCRTSCGPPP